MVVENSVWFGTSVHGPNTVGADSSKPPFGPIHCTVNWLPLMVNNARSDQFILKTPLDAMFENPH